MFESLKFLRNESPNLKYSKFAYFELIDSDFKSEMLVELASENGKIPIFRCILDNCVNEYIKANYNNIDIGKNIIKITKFLADTYYNVNNLHSTMILIKQQINDSIDMCEFCDHQYDDIIIKLFDKLLILS